MSNSSYHLLTVVVYPKVKVNMFLVKAGYFQQPHYLTLILWICSNIDSILVSMLHYRSNNLARLKNKERKSGCKLWIAEPFDICWIKVFALFILPYNKGTCVTYLKFHYFLLNGYNMFLAAPLHKANCSMAAPTVPQHERGFITVKMINLIPIFVI